MTLSQTDYWLIIEQWTKQFRVAQGMKVRLCLTVIFCDFTVSAMATTGSGI